MSFPISITIPQNKLDLKWKWSWTIHMLWMALIGFFHCCLDANCMMACSLIEQLNTRLSLSDKCSGSILIRILLSLLSHSPFSFHLLAQVLSMSSTFPLFISSWICYYFLCPSASSVVSVIWSAIAQTLVSESETHLRIRCRWGGGGGVLVLEFGLLLFHGGTNTIHRMVMDGWWGREVWVNKFHISWWEGTVLSFLQTKEHGGEKNPDYIFYWVRKQMANAPQTRPWSSSPSLP